MVGKGHRHTERERLTHTCGEGRGADTQTLHTHVVRKGHRHTERDVHTHVVREGAQTQ